MDKQKEKQISIKINGQEKKYHVNDEIAVANESEDNHWQEQSSRMYEREIIDLDELRKRRKGYNMKNKPASTLANRKGPFHSLKKRTSFGKPLKSMRISQGKGYILAIILAIIIGTALGIAILAIFSGVTNVIPESNQNQIVTEVEGKGSQVGGVSQTASSNKPVPITLPNTKVFVIQGGAFSSMSAAESAAATLKNKGYAAQIIDSGNPVYLFIGLGLTEQSVSPISDIYKGIGQEVYVKPYNIEPPTIALTNKEAIYMKEGMVYYQKILEASSNLLGGSVDQDKLTKVMNSTNAWLIKKPEALPSEANQFVNAISGAYQALSSYRSSNDQQYLWSAQQQLLNGLVYYQSIGDKN